MKRTLTFLPLLMLLFSLIGSLRAQNEITYGFVQDPVDPLKLTAVAYPNFSSNNVTVSTALFTFYLTEGTVTNPAIPVLPAFGSFTDITGTWRIEKITPALYASFGFDPNDLQGNDIYQCILQNSPSPNTTAGQPVSLFSLRLPGDCAGGMVQVHINDNGIQQALLNNVGININNQMSVSVNDAPSVDLYIGNNPATDNYDCPLDDAPAAVDDAVTTNEDVVVTVNVTANDSFGTDGPAIGPITIITNPTNGVAVVNDNGTPNDPTDDSITYTPNPDFNGSDSVTYQICDADNDCDQAVLVITINPVNDLPMSPDTTITTPEDTPVSVCVPITDVDNSSFTVTTLCQPDNGSVSGLTNPATSEYCLTYTPDPNYTGPDTICILVCDGMGGCDTSYVSIDVTPVNDPPVAQDTLITTPEDTPISVCVPITDVDDASFSVTALCQPDHGMISGLTDPATSEYCLTYTPDLNYYGPDTICILVCDGMGGCDTSYVSIDVTPVNDPPVAQDTIITTPEDTPISVCVPITDVDNTSFSVTTLCQPDHGMISGLTDPATSEYCLTYTPNTNYTGADTICILVCDGMSACDTSYVFIDVTPINDPPIVSDTTVTTPEDTPITVCVPITDTDNASFTVTTLCQPDHGTISGLTNPATSEYCLTYTPDLNYNGPDTLCILICDGAGGCDTSYVSIDITPVNDPPIANDDNATTQEDTPVTFNVTNNDTDVDGNINPASLDLDTGTGGIQNSVTVAGGTFTCDAAGNVTFTPNANFNGMATTDYQVCDDGTPLPALCDVATITVTVNAVNDPPIANDDSATTNEDTPVTFNVTNNDTDVDGAIDLATLDLDTGTPGVQNTFTIAGQGTFTRDGAGNVTFTPVLNFNGIVTSQYQVCDNGTPLPAQCDQATITVTVNPVNDPPIANDDSATTNEDTPVTFNVITNDTDVDGAIDPASLDLDTGTPGIQTSFVVAGGTFTYNGVGNVTFTPNANFNGTAMAQYLVCDNGTPLPALCDIADITVTVNAVNDPPIANDDNATTNEDTPVTFNVTNNDTDSDGAIDLATLDLDTGTPGVQTTVTIAGQGTFTRDGAGNVTFTPVLNFNGTVTSLYQICDNGTPLPAQCDQALITVIVAPINDPPLANDDSASTPEDTPISIPVLNNDTDVDGALNPASVVITDGPNNGTTSINPLTGAITYTPNLDFVGNDTLVYTVCDTGTPVPVMCDNATVIISVTATSVRLIGKMRLQGALYNSPDTLMRDNLRSLGRIPVNEPYTALPSFVHVGGGGEFVTDSALVFANYGANAIVDWVFVELRDPNNPALVVATRSALLQRDGDIVDVNGTSALVFENTTPAFYYVAIRHRNHLGSMTAGSISMTNEGTLIDFTNLATPLWDDNTNLNGFEQVTINGKYALWAGNVNTNKSVVFAGQSNDKDPVFNQIDQAPGNIFHSQSYVYNGYHLGDVNLDGKAIFAGQNNDVDFIFNNVDGHPRNVTHSQSYVIRQQLAE